MKKEPVITTGDDSGDESNENQKKHKKGSDVSTIKNSTKTNISVLFDEIWYEITKFMDPSSFKNMMTVNSRYHDIMNMPSMDTYLPILLKLHIADFEDFSFKTYYQNRYPAFAKKVRKPDNLDVEIVIEGDDSCYERIAGALLDSADIGKYIRCLYIRHKSDELVAYPDKLFEILHKHENLKTLEIESGFYKDSTLKSIEKYLSNNPALKHLSFIGADKLTCELRSCKKLFQAISRGMNENTRLQGLHLNDAGLNTTVGLQCSMNL